jgi:hypothetical protein
MLRNAAEATSQQGTGYRGNRLAIAANDRYCGKRPAIADR